MSNGQSFLAVAMAWDVEMNLPYASINNNDDDDNDDDVFLFIRMREGEWEIDKKKIQEKCRSLSIGGRLNVRNTVANHKYLVFLGVRV